MAVQLYVNVPLDGIDFWLTPGTPSDQGVPFCLAICQYGIEETMGLDVLYAVEMNTCFCGKMIIDDELHRGQFNDYFVGRLYELQPDLLERCSALVQGIDRL